MRSLFITAAVVTAAIALGGCPNKRREPVPGPQSAAAHNVPASSDERDDASRRDTSTGGQRASEISWFQGTLEEAFSRTSCHEPRALFRY